VGQTSRAAKSTVWQGGFTGDRQRGGVQGGKGEIGERSHRQIHGASGGKRKMPNGGSVEGKTEPGMPAYVLANGWLQRGPVTEAGNAVNNNP